MKLFLWTAMLLSLFACGSDDLPLGAGEEVDSQQPALDTETRSEPDQQWDRGIEARNITWSYVSSSRLANSISIVGTLKITFANTNPDQEISAEVMLRLIGADGFHHVPLTPFSRVTIPANDTIEVRENFIVEMKNQSVANDVARMSIVLF
jgi:hypothetical protein